MSQKIILDLTTPEIITLHNMLSKTAVTKFRDRKTAESRLYCLTVTNSTGLLEAMKTAKIRPTMIAKFEYELKHNLEEATAAAATPKTEPESHEATPTEGKGGGKTKVASKVKKTPKTEPEKTPKGSSRSHETIQEGPVPQAKSDDEAQPQETDSSDPAWAAAAKPLLATQAVEKEKLAHLPQPVKKIKKPRIPQALENDSKAAGVLWHIQQEMNRLNEKGEDEVMTSTDVARVSITSIKEAIRQLDLLKALGYAEIEDDSTDIDSPFYYITLTQLGKDFALRPAGTKEPKAARQPRTTLPGAKPGPRSDKAELIIHKLIQENPRREGVVGWKSWNLIRTGMSYEQYIEAGGRSIDLQWDINHGWVELK